MLSSVIDFTDWACSFGVLSSTVMTQWSSTVPPGWQIVSAQDTKPYRQAYTLRDRVVPIKTGLPPARPRMSLLGGTYRRHCSKCPEYSYTDPTALRQHCKSEWHVDNVKRSQSGLAPLSYEEWLQLSLASDSEEPTEVDSEEEEAEEFSEPEINGFIMDNYPWKILTNCSPRIALASTIDPDVWASSEIVVVLLFRSGRFAGCVWDGDGKVIEHTTFKKCTVRRKQGGAQRNFEQAKSMGAFMRRTQDAKIREDVSELISDRWREYLSNPKALVLVGSPRQDQNSVFVGPLKNGYKDPRVAKVPLTFRAPTFTETLRVYDVLMRVMVEVPPDD
ncbi:Ankyrin repeat and zinc finger domain-containing protein 1 [Perkinsus chesapeaki]|uniref:Ankyrin repeat and zinc finger domain-containing protein 1 n=1 Tax=Perkinsus chesapeaki TaxID=330153 RepID=A0A7J6N2F8_PERCH|nr:Ankyrin repeat and zinc finger domain-containing protein 1 [Perkinsus chesapeaki]